MGLMLRDPMPQAAGNQGRAQISRWDSWNSYPPLDCLPPAYGRGPRPHPTKPPQRGGVSHGTQQGTKQEGLVYA